MNVKGVTATLALVLAVWAFNAVGDEGAAGTGSANDSHRAASGTSGSAGTSRPAAPSGVATALERQRPQPRTGAARSDDKRRGRRERIDADRDTSSTTQPRSRRSARTYSVARVIDGDTLVLRNGETVRLTGIDTPEVGQCGHDRATVHLERLVLGKRVRLARSDEDRDRYGRLLRYVDVGHLDAGLSQIRNGLAVARYDSRDGYGYHPREPRYLEADADSEDPSCGRPAPVAGRDAQPGSGASTQGCAPGYRPCVRPYPPDLDCADVEGPVRVLGSDPHGLDADGDGVACE